MMRVELAPIEGYPSSFHPCIPAAHILEVAQGAHLVHFIWADPDGFLFEECAMFKE